MTFNTCGVPAIERLYVLYPGQRLVFETVGKNGLSTLVTLAIRHRYTLVVVRFIGHLDKPKIYELHRHRISAGRECQLKRPSILEEVLA